MELPLRRTEGDQCGRLQQHFMHLKQFLPQRLEVAAKVNLLITGCTGFPLLVLLTGVECETGKKPHFERTEKDIELLLRTGNVERQVRMPHYNRIAIHLVR